MKLTVKKRFDELHRSLTDDEFKELESDIVSDGRVRDPIVIMKGDVIVDGHNRYAIATNHKLKFEVVVKSFADDDAAERWILRHQLARRNLSPHDYKLALGRLYNSEKKDPNRPPEKVRQSDGVNSKTVEKQGSTADIVAKQVNLSPRTVERSGKYAAAFDKLPQAVKTLVQENKSVATEKAVIKMAGMSASDLTAKAREVRTGQSATFDVALGLKAGVNGKAPTKVKKKSGQATVSAASLVDGMLLHFKGAKGLPQSLDAVATVNGGKGMQYEIANNALNEVVVALHKMRGGSR